MPSIRARVSLVATAFLLTLGSPFLLAEKPEWTPIAELLVGSLGNADPAGMSAVMTRCTALNMTLAGLSSEFSPEMSQHFQDEAHRLIQHGVLIESQLVKTLTGLDADLDTVSDDIIEEVKGLLVGYSDWMDDNELSDGSYLNKDIDLEMDSCQLASKILNQMNVH